jgi:hypothetical protein
VNKVTLPCKVDSNYRLTITNSPITLKPDDTFELAIEGVIAPRKDLRDMAKYQTETVFMAVLQEQPGLSNVRPSYPNLDLRRVYPLSSAPSSSDPSQVWLHHPYGSVNREGYHQGSLRPCILFAIRNPSPKRNK